MIITDEMIEKLRTPRGGWTRDGLASLGVPWPPPKGWRRRIVGEELPAKVTADA